MQYEKLRAFLAAKDHFGVPSSPYCVSIAGHQDVKTEDILAVGTERERITECGRHFGEKR